MSARNTSKVAVSAVSPIKTVNVASVPQLSPFRYPGGKTWLFPWIKRWLLSLNQQPLTLVDAFAGGGSVSLAAVFNNLANQAIMIELDDNVASVWETILNGNGEKLATRIEDFDISAPRVSKVLSSTPLNTEERAFATLLMNRTRYGGIIAPGSASIKNGENGRGISSRWYPKTLARRIRAILEKRGKFIFLHEDSMEFLRLAQRHRNVAYFFDPPYTVAGRRLYSHSEIDHEKLFWTASRLNGDILFTYDDAAQIRSLAEKFQFCVKEVPMRSTKHELKQELIIGRALDWVTNSL